MTFRKTAGLASLLLSFPLAAPALSVAGDWGTTAETGTDSGNNVSFPQDGQTTQSCGTVYIGYAKEDTAYKADASSNTGTMNSGLTITNKLYGGYAYLNENAKKDAVLTTNENKLFLKDGTILKHSNAYTYVKIYGGFSNTNYALTNSTSAKSNDNEVYIGNENKEDVVKGVQISGYADIRGGYSYNYKSDVDSSAEASGNTVTIYEGVSFDKNVSIYAGEARYDNGNGSVTASGNTLNMTIKTAIKTNDVVIGNANADSNTNGTVKAVADGNKGTWVFGDNAQLASAGDKVVGGWARNYHGDAQANSNELDITGGEFLDKLITGWAAGGGEINANSNITNVTKIIHRGDSIYDYRYFAGGYAEGRSYNITDTVTAKKNITTVTESKMNYAWSGCADANYGGKNAYTESNEMTMTSSTADYAYAGYSAVMNWTNVEREAYAKLNTLTLDKTVAGISYGGCAEALIYKPASSGADAATKLVAKAESNNLILKDADSEYAYAGYSYAKNYVGSGNADDPSASKKEAYVSKNTLTVAGGSSTLASSGYAVSDNIAEATENYVYLNYDPELAKNLETETTINGALYAGYAEGTKAKATGNKGSLVNAVFSDDGGEFSGGMAVAAYNEGGEATASQNVFSITGGSLANVYGGQAIATTDSTTATADKNVLTLSGAEVRKTLYGGYASSTVDTDDDDSAVSGDASAKTNTLSLYGGTYGGDIYAGYALATNSTAESGSNTVGLYALNGDSPSFAETTVIWGGYASKGGTEVASTGNTLTFNDVNGMKVANIKNFQNLTFTYQNTTLATNDVVLTLTGTEADEASGRVAEPTTTIADGGEISVSVTSLKGEGDEAVFKKGDKVYLLQNKNGLDIQTNNLTLKTTTAKTGNGALVCTIELEKDGNSLYLTRTDSDGEDGKKDNEPAIKAAPETKAIAEGALAGLALVSESSEAVFEVIDEIAEQDLFTFGTVHAASKAYESGSSINVSSVSLIAGLGKGFAFDAGHLSVGAFFEYGKGSYTTHNSFDDRADIDGDGNNWYMGGGILAKMNFKDTGPGHFYVEGSAHMGTVHNEFDSNGFTDGFGNVAKFDMDSPYYSLHGGLGYVWNFAEGHELKMYGKYIWTMVQGTDDTLTTNAKFDYDDMHSNRVRGGVRYSYTGSERFKPYVGVAYEHEFSGSCDSRAFGYDVNSPSYEGDTGIGELGISMMPSDALPLSFNLGVQGSVGKKRGISGTCNAVYEF